MEAIGNLGENLKKRGREGPDYTENYSQNRIVTAEFLFDNEEDFQVYDDSSDVDSPLFRADAGVWAPQCFVEPCAWHTHSVADKK